MAQKPIAKFRAGQISCAVWENEISVDGATKTILKASVSRRYKDSSGNWKSSQSFARNEIPLAIYCLGKAFEAIIGEESGTSADGDNTVEEMVA